MTKLLRSLMKDTGGATAAEYGLMLTLIAVAILVTVTLLGENLKALFESQEINDALKP